MNPKILIQYNRFLDPIFDAYIKAQPQWKEWITPSREVVDANIEMYKKEWVLHGESILTAIQEITGLTFRRNEIDVYIVSGNPRSFSRPIVMKARYSRMDFINTLSHELIHVLFSDNEFHKKDPYPECHVVVFAVLTYIYLDVLKKPEHLTRNRETSVGQSRYVEAWEFVEKEGYKTIISKVLRNK